MHYETLWTFKTANFVVTWSVAPDDDLDLSFDETGEVKEKLESGEWTAFVSRMRVMHRETGAVLGEEFLGGSIYADPREFRDHIGLHSSRNNYGSYFRDMVHAACKEARTAMAKLQDVKVHA
jgi:hypothetical protein